MKNNGEFNAQLRLAVPLAIGHLGHQFMNVVDTAMLGRYSDAALAGSGLANGLLWTVTLFGMGVLMGMDSLVPQAVGAGQHGRARAFLRQGLRTAVTLAVPITLLAALIPLFMSFMKVEASTQAEAARYVLGRLPAILPVLLFTTLRLYLQAHSVTRPMLVAVLVGNVVNVLGNVLLIYGDRSLVAAGLPGVGLPELGALGAAISTTIVTVVSLLLCVSPTIAVYRRSQEQDRDASDVSDMRAHGPTLRRAIWRKGLPIGAQLFAEVGAFALIGTLAGRLGTVAAAAHQSVLTIISFGFNGALGIAAATSVRVGLAVGMGDHLRARRAGFVGLAMGIVSLGVTSVVFLAFPRFCGSLMSDQATVIEAAVPMFYVAAVFQVFDALQVVGAGALRGAGDTRSPLWAHLIGHYCIGMSIAVTLAFVMELGAVGLWWGLCAGLMFAGVVVAARFTQLTRHPIAPSLEL